MISVLNGLIDGKFCVRKTLDFTIYKLRRLTLRIAILSHFTGLVKEEAARHGNCKHFQFTKKGKMRIGS